MPLLASSARGHTPFAPMPIRLFKGSLALGLLSVSAVACAPAMGDQESKDPVEALDESAEMAQLRRENERLTRRVQQLEERARLMGGGSEPMARNDAASSSRSQRRRSSTGAPYDLPVVQVEPEGSGPVRPTDAVTLGEMPNSGVDFDDAERDDPAGWSSWDEQGPAEAPAPAASADEGVQSYRLVGSRLVKATQEPAKQKQRAPSKSTRSKKSRAKHQDEVLNEYEAAMSIYKAGRFREAELAFDGIVRRFADHDYADNALYWKGESAYDQEHYADALAAFTAVVERYGGGNKAPDALLKIGLCYGKLGDSANARDVLTQLIAAYPRARASKLAKSRLEDFSAE